MLTLLKLVNTVLLPLCTSLLCEHPMVLVLDVARVQQLLGDALAVIKRPNLLEKVCREVCVLEVTEKLVSFLETLIETRLEVAALGGL